eukprot:scaffold5163_cov66-Phaeocystis_antarctica.AAC.1
MPSTGSTHQAGGAATAREALGGGTRSRRSASEASSQLKRSAARSVAPPSGTAKGSSCLSGA